MKEKNLWQELTSFNNLFLAWKKARRGKTKKHYVMKFEENLLKEIFQLQEELETQTYFPRPQKIFILRDPKTRKISKSHFRDRIVHHALCNIIEPIFDKTFIYDSCANRKRKGGLFALKQLEKYKGKVTNNLTSKGYCLKADVKHYFNEVDHKTLLNVLGRKIKDIQVMWLLEVIVEGGGISYNRKGMPLGNLTSQFFANVYLNELDQFVKHELKSKYYIRYVDDFVLLHSSKEQLKFWKEKIKIFLHKELKLEIHPDKSKIINLSKGVDFVGFRTFYHYRLLRKRSIRNIQRKIKSFEDGKILEDKFFEIWQGWSAYANLANTHSLKGKLSGKINNNFYK